MEYTHIKYGFGDFLSDIGGVSELIIFCFGIFLYPLSENSFLLKAIKKLYTARTRNMILLQKVDGQNPHTGKPLKSVRFEFSNDDENRVQDLEELQEAELEKRRPIVLSMKNKAYLYVRTLCCIKGKKNSGASQVVRLFEKGKEKLREDFDVV